MSPGPGTARRVPDKYLKLIRSFPLRPIRTDAENDEAVEVIASLGAREPLDPAERDYLDVLVDLVRKYEADHYPIPPVSGPAVVRHLIEARGVTQAEVASAAGIAESSLSEMLAGKRKMATRHVKALARFFGVSADTILGD
jgi:HTH-type transcriptional regulator/antitoxin HigA